ncbi:MAG: VOC family protein [Actinobacteria bacterium]|nr:MAG: VOC family protein [Actinomycetota bacterium]
MSATDGERPPVWVGHLHIYARDPKASAVFYEAIGMRSVWVADDVAIFELRGGTHLVVLPTAEPQAGPAEFDLMVDDLAATHAEWAAQGLTVSEIVTSDIHQSFTVTDPDHHEITVNNTHVVGPV